MTSLSSFYQTGENVSGPEQRITPSGNIITRDPTGIQTLDYIQAAYIDTREITFDGYWSSRGKNLRHNIRKNRNRLVKSDISPSLVAIRNPGEVKQAVAAYCRLESAGWKNDGGTAIHADNIQGTFYSRLMADLCMNRQGCIYQYYYNDELAASDMCVEKGGVFVILKTTYNTEYSRTSPAFLMRHEMFKEIFGRSDVHRIEFYGKLMEWHTRWSDMTKMLYHVNCTRI